MGGGASGDCIRNFELKYPRGCLDLAETWFIHPAHCLPMKHHSIRALVFLSTAFWWVMGALANLQARAGGAGGHSDGGHSNGGSHGGGSSFGGGSHSYGSRGSGGGGSVFSFFCFFFIMAAVILLVILIMRNKSTGGVRFSKAPPLPRRRDGGGMEAFLAANPGFDIEAFKRKVGEAFLRIQAAWTAQDLAGVRRFISDGIYQRFATQFHMMGLLKQRNALGNIRILSIDPVAATKDGEYDVMQVSVRAAMSDSFVCELDHSLDSESDEPFVEYWSFIRKQQPVKADADMYQKQSCPSCGAPLPEDMGELCRCEYCKVMVNSGEFDWILAEITQEEDYGDGSAMAAHVSPDLAQAVAELSREAPDLAVQLTEDKASNAFMQIMTALATRNPAVVRRFVSDDALADITAFLPKRPIIFNRLYLNEAVLLDACRHESRHALDVGMTASLQRVEMTPGGFTPVDEDLVRPGYVITLERDAAAVPNKGALYQHQCPNCSGAVGDTLDLNCQYCGVPLNSMKNEWIVTRFAAIEKSKPPNRRTG